MKRELKLEALEQLCGAKIIGSGSSSSAHFSSRRSPSGAPRKGQIDGGGQIDLSGRNQVFGSP